MTLKMVNLWKESLFSPVKRRTWTHYWCSTMWLLHFIMKSWVMKFVFYMTRMNFYVSGIFSVRISAQAKLRRSLNLPNLRIDPKVEVTLSLFVICAQMKDFYFEVKAKITIMTMKHGVKNEFCVIVKSSLSQLKIYEKRDPLFRLKLIYRTVSEERTGS